MSEVVVAVIAPTLLAASCLLLLLAGASDIATRRVPNWVSAWLAAIGATLHVTAGDLPASLGAAATVFLLGALCWRRGWLGGGDVKLLASAALLVAPSRVPGLMLAVALAGGALAATYLLLRRLSAAGSAPAFPEKPASNGSERKTRLGRIVRIERWRIRRGAPLPYASAIFAGVIFMLLSH